MSDLDLREAFEDLASLAEQRDLLPAVHQGVRRRRRRRSASAVILTAVTVAAVVAGARTVTHGTGTGIPPAGHDKPSPSTSTPPLPLEERVPRYVPPGARVVSKGRGGAEPATAGVYHVTYRSNRAKISFVVIDDRRLPRCPSGDPARQPHLRTPCGQDTQWLFTFSPLAAGYDQAINGRTAHVADAVNHFGVQDVEWREGPYHYVLDSERLNKPEGPTGLPFAEIVRMAQSVPSDPSVAAEPPLPNPPDVSIPVSALDGYQRYDRQLIDGNGASVSFSKSPRGAFSIYVVDASVTAAMPPLYALNDVDPALARERGATLVHMTIRGHAAIGWRGPADFVGLRCRIDGFTVGFLGRFGVTLDDYRRIAGALRVIPHAP